MDIDVSHRKCCMCEYTLMDFASPYARACIHCTIVEFTDLHARLFIALVTLLQDPNFLLLYVCSISLRLNEEQEVVWNSLWYSYIYTYQRYRVKECMCGHCGTSPISLP